MIKMYPSFPRYLLDADLLLVSVLIMTKEAVNSSQQALFEFIDQ